MVVEANDSNNAIEKVQTAKKICNEMQSTDRKTRKQAFVDLESYLKNEELSAQDLRNIFSETAVYFLNGVRDKTESVREQSIKFLTFLIVDKLLLNDFYLTYVMPVIVERIGSVELVEESEEIRLQLVQFLSAIIRKYSKSEQLKPFLNDMVIILGETVKDKYPAIKELSCKTIIQLSEALPRDFHMQAETLIKPVITCLTHQRYRVRVEAIKAIGELVMHSTYKGLDESVGPLAEKLFDQIPAVRQAVGQVAARWLLEYRDRYSFFQKILPLLLTGLNDEVFETRSEAHTLWEQVGLQYQHENEKELKDKLDFLTQVPDYYPTDLKRPNLGCRVLVERNASKMAPAIARELKSWQGDVRLRCAQLLCAVALHAEESLTFNLQSILPAMYSAGRDDDARVVSNIRRASEIIGLFVSCDTWLKLVVPAVEEGPHYGHLVVINGLIKGAPRVNIKQFFKDITKILADDYICYSRKLKYQVEMLNCVKSIIEKMDKSDEITSYNLFKIITGLVALKNKEQIDKINENLYEDLAICCGYENAQNIFEKYTNILLKEINKDPQSWSTTSNESRIFLTLLLYSKQSLEVNSKIILSILENILNNSDGDSEFRLETFYTLATILESNETTFKVDFFTDLTTKILLPSLIWKAGSTAEAIRTMSSVCLKFSLIALKNSKISQLESLINELLPLLVSLSEDASWRSREMSLECFALLKMHCVENKIWSYEYLVKMYPEILRRLDDPTDKVRRSALRVVAGVFDDCPEKFKSGTCRSHHQLIIDTLLIHLDDEDETVQKYVIDALKSFVNVNKEELRDKVEKHLTLVRNKTMCEQLIEYIDTV